MKSHFRVTSRESAVFDTGDRRGIDHMATLTGLTCGVSGCRVSMTLTLSSPDPDDLAGLKVGSHTEVDVMFSETPVSAAAS